MFVRFHTLQRSCKRPEEGVRVFSRSWLFGGSVWRPVLVVPRGVALASPRAAAACICWLIDLT